MYNIYNLSSMDLSIFELANTLLGKKLEGGNLVGCTNPSGTVLEKSAIVQDYALGSSSTRCGVRRVSLDLALANHVPR